MRGVVQTTEVRKKPPQTLMVVPVEDVLVNQHTQGVERSVDLY